MSQKTKTLLTVSILLAMMLATAGGLFSRNLGLAYQNEATAEFSTRIQKTEGAASLPLAFTGPKSAAVGDTVVFTVKGDGLESLAGYQLSLQFDPAGLRFAGASISEELKGMDTDILAVGPVRVGNVIHFGAVSCPVADCASYDYQQERFPTDQIAGDTALAQISFVVKAPGSYALSLNRAEFANPQALSAQEEIALEALDLTRNGFVNDSDAWEAVGAWADLLPQGLCITPAQKHYDIDQNGCIDVTDVQLILNRWGERTSRFPDRIPGPSGITEETFTVDDAGDESDINPGNGVCATAVGACTLRAAIEEANAYLGRDTIQFDIRNPDGSCPALVILEPATTLYIDDPDGDGVELDGYTQCGASPNTEPIDGNAVIKIELQGNQTAGIYGLRVGSQLNVIRGVAVYDFNYQILLRGERAQYNSIEGSFIGTNAANTHLSSFPGENDGLRVDWSASNNMIGGTEWSQRNLISGNDQDGLGYQGPDVTFNVAINNYMGLKQDGVSRLRNQSDGVDIAGGAHDNRIGGLDPRERNVISGNNGDGMEISHDNVHDNEVVGNFIGLNATGSALTRNDKRGITFEDIVTNNQVHRNIIVGNGGYGIRIYTADGNHIFDNFIGAYPSGLGPEDVVPLPSTVPFEDLIEAPNGSDPPALEGLSGVFMIGGSQSNVLERNIIAYHPEYGIQLSAEKGYLDIGTCETYFNTFSQNSLFDNEDEGIHFTPAECNGVTFYPNQGISEPVITSATTSLVSGTTCANCTVEVFIADKTDVQDPGGDNFGEGKIYLATGTANASGEFEIPVSGVEVDQLVTATTTDASGNTSPFARNVLVGSAPTPTTTVTTTATVTTTPTETVTPTNTPTATVTVTPTPPTPIVEGPYTVNLPMVVNESD